MKMQRHYTTRDILKQIKKKDLVGTQIVGFLMDRLKYDNCQQLETELTQVLKGKTNASRHEDNFVYMRRRRRQILS